MMQMQMNMNMGMDVNMNLPSISTGQIFIELNQGYYHPGDTVSGNIYLNLYESYPSGKIKLKFKGWETTQWMDMDMIAHDPNSNIALDKDDCLSGSDCNISSTSTDSSDCKEKPKKGYFKNKKDGQYYKLNHYIGGKEFVKQNIPLQGFQGGPITGGQYQIPFSFVLNSQWPGTFSYKQSKEKVRIKYEIRVKCELDDGKDREFKHTQEILVQERINSKGAENKKIKTDVKSCCCLSKGTTEFQVQFEKNTYELGEDANLICEVNNTICEVNVDKIQADLVHRLKLKDKKNNTHIIKNVLASKQFQGVGSGQKTEIKEKLKIENKLKSKKKVISPTVKGSFVESEYFLEVRCDMDALCNGCCNQIPEVSIPVNIIATPFVIIPFTKPQSWNPKICPVFNIALTSSDVLTNMNVNMGVYPNMVNQAPVMHQDIKITEKKDHSKMNQVGSFQMNVQVQENHNHTTTTQQQGFGMNVQTYDNVNDNSTSNLKQGFNMQLQDENGQQQQVQMNMDMEVREY